MRVSAVRNLNLGKAKRLAAPSFSGAKKAEVSPEGANLKAKNTSYVPRMLATIGIGLAILWGTARIFKDKTAPLSYLWK